MDHHDLNKAAAANAAEHVIKDLAEKNALNEVNSIFCLLYIISTLRFTSKLQKT